MAGIQIKPFLCFQNKIFAQTLQLLQKATKVCSKSRFSHLGNENNILSWNSHLKIVPKATKIISKIKSLSYRLKIRMQNMIRNLDIHISALKLLNIDMQILNDLKTKKPRYYLNLMDMFNLLLEFLFLFCEVNIKN